MISTNMWCRHLWITLVVAVLKHLAKTNGFRGGHYKLISKKYNILQKVLNAIFLKQLIHHDFDKYVVPALTPNRRAESRDDFRTQVDFLLKQKGSDVETERRNREEVWEGGKEIEGERGEMKENRYVSGYKNRFQNFIKHIREMGDEVMVVTTHEGLPKEFYGAKCIGSLSFPCPWYKKVPLSLALSPRIIAEVARFKPDIIHASSPGIMVFGALAIAKMFCVPIVMSYHTHVPVYIPRYTFSWLVKPMWLIIKFLHGAADLTLVPSVAIRRDLEAARVTSANKIRLWSKGVDSESFHPRFRNHEMRVRLSDGEPEKPLILHVGRLGVEKNLDFLKRVMDRLPGSRIAFVGDGPYRRELEKMFEGMPAVFTGMLQGEELSQAYASGDVFVMPSESETLGLVVLEAMSSGVPTVAARAGGIIDIIPFEQDGKTSFLFYPGDVDDCVAKIELLISDKEFWEAMSKAARTEMEKYDWREATRNIRDVQYNAAIWFWRKERAQFFRPVKWLVKRLIPSSVHFL